MQRDAKKFLALRVPNCYKRCVARVTVSLRVWGLSVCVRYRRCACVRNRCRNCQQLNSHRHLREVAMVVLIGSAKSGLFWRFRSSRNVVSCGRCGTLWHCNMFHNVSKVDFLWQARWFCFAFRWVPFFAASVAGAALERHPYLVCLAGLTVQTCRVQQFRRFVLHAFSNCISAASRSWKVQIP